MNTASYVDHLIVDLKNRGIPFSEAAWQTALACIGWPYVFGSWGAYCTVAERKKRYRESHPTIKTKCKAFDGGSCDGCQWYPNDERVRCFDCRGFTDYVLKQFGFDLVGEGATGQWNTASNWSKKGLVSDGIPQGVIVCLFYTDKDNPQVMAHTGLYYNGETCECSNGVQHFKTLNKKWTHWAIPACIEDKGIGEPVYHEPAEKPTLRRGNKGAYVTLLQTKLFERGYDLGSYGIDGDFGKATESAVKEFQKDNGLVSDGIVGKATWDALINNSVKLYTVTIPHLTMHKADELIRQYGNGAYMTLEG